MESKFLSDGRKVTIIGQLNNTEWNCGSGYYRDSSSSKGGVFEIEH